MKEIPPEERSKFYNSSQLPLLLSQIDKSMVAPLFSLMNKFSSGEIDFISIELRTLPSLLLTDSLVILPLLDGAEERHHFLELMHNDLIPLEGRG